MIINGFTQPFTLNEWHFLHGSLYLLKYGKHFTSYCSGAMFMLIHKVWSDTPQSWGSGQLLSMPEYFTVILRAHLQEGNKGPQAQSQTPIHCLYGEIAPHMDESGEHYNAASAGQRVLCSRALCCTTLQSLLNVSWTEMMLCREACFLTGWWISHSVSNFHRDTSQIWTRTVAGKIKIHWVWLHFLWFYWFLASCCSPARAETCKVPVMKNSCLHIKARTFALHYFPTVFHNSSFSDLFLFLLLISSR